MKHEETSAVREGPIACQHIRDGGQCRERSSRMLNITLQLYTDNHSACPAARQMRVNTRPPLPGNIATRQLP
jgi:hypothetical protein